MTRRVALCDAKSSGDDDRQNGKLTALVFDWPMIFPKKSFPRADRR
jgi:hypothetical protein